jgi:hypothetical protein
MLFLTSFYLCDVVEVNQDEDVPICLPAGKRLGLRNQTITLIYSMLSDTCEPPSRNIHTYGFRQNIYRGGF